MSQFQQCPVCDSVDIVKREKFENITESFGGSMQVSIAEFYCTSCETSFEDDNDDTIQASIDELKSKAVINILNDFLHHGFNLSSMERALELPQRTLAKWKSNGKPSAAGVSLLKILRCFPWILEVAENKYDFQIAQKTFTKTALDYIVDNSSFMDPFHSKVTQKSSPIFFQFNHTENNISSPQTIIVQTDSNKKQMGLNTSISENIVQLQLP